MKKKPEDRVSETMRPEYDFSRAVAAHGTVSRRLVSQRGTRSIVDGAVASPTKLIVVLRTVWIGKDPC